MQVVPTDLPGVLELDITPQVDARGFFARLFCAEELQRTGVSFQSTQINLSRNTQTLTLRGLHYQMPPFAEAKIVRVVKGSIYDVVVDVRLGSATRFKWIGRTLDAARANALFIPEGFAHGFMTLETGTDVLYQMGRPFVPGHAAGLRYDDPRLAVAWPDRPATISDQDLAWPLIDGDA